MARNSYLTIAKDLLADKSVSMTAKLLFSQLLDHMNRQTGQCYPKELTLARELGVSRWTVIRRLDELKTVGLIEIRRSQRGNRYEFPKLQSATSQVANCNFPKLQTATSGVAGPLYEPNLKGTYARARKRAADFPPNQNHNNGTAAVPRKSATSETLEAYNRLYGTKS